MRGRPGEGASRHAEASDGRREDVNQAEYTSIFPATMGVAVGLFAPIRDRLGRDVVLSLLDDETRDHEFKVRRHRHLQARARETPEDGRKGSPETLARSSIIVWVIPSVHRAWYFTSYSFPSRCFEHAASHAACDHPQRLKWAVQTHSRALEAVRRCAAPAHLAG